METEVTRYGFHTESRMRETCTYGSMRGRTFPTGRPALLYTLPYMFYYICLTTRNGCGRLRGTLRLNARHTLKRTSAGGLGGDRSRQTLVKWAFRGAQSEACRRGRRQRSTRLRQRITGWDPWRACDFHCVLGNSGKITRRRGGEGRKGVDV